MALELRVLNCSSADPEMARQTLVPETADGGLSVAATTTTTAVSTGTVSMDARTKAKMQGYEGDPCGDCGNYTLVRNGTCMKCNTCGATSGCS
jgi:ribonucleoside-diphosphate reductase alpha chain